MDQALFPALKAAILAETAPEFVAYRQAGNKESEMAQWLNTAHDSELAWKKAASWGPIFAALDGSLYTPQPAQVTGANDATATKLLLVNLLKLTMQQNYLLAMQTVDASNEDVRNALVDQVTNAYTLNGNNRTNPGGVGGAAIVPSMVRPALRVELIFGGQVSATGGVTARALNYEGTVTAQEISDALAS